MTVVNWEKGHTQPRINHMAGVSKFLGFNPIPTGDTLAERIMNHRRALGITQQEFAEQLGVYPSTLARWERGERQPPLAFDAMYAHLCTREGESGWQVLQ